MSAVETESPLSTNVPEGGKPQEGTPDVSKVDIEKPGKMSTVETESPDVVSKVNIETLGTVETEQEGTPKVDIEAEEKPGKMSTVETEPEGGKPQEVEAEEKPGKMTTVETSSPDVSKVDIETLVTVETETPLSTNVPEGQAKVDIETLSAEEKPISTVETDVPEGGKPQEGTPKVDIEAEEKPATESPETLVAEEKPGTEGGKPQEGTPDVSKVDIETETPLSTNVPELQEGTPKVDIETLSAEEKPGKISTVETESTHVPEGGKPQEGTPDVSKVDIETETPLSTEGQAKVDIETLSAEEKPISTVETDVQKPQEGTPKVDIEAEEKPATVETESPDVSLFAEEKPGWIGYVEWEKYPEKKELARDILITKKFTPIPEFQFVPLPKTNPILIGHRWKEYHEVLGLKSIVDFSWQTVQTEKPDLIHLLDFPYNGETTRPQLLEGKITSNKYHFIRNHGGVPNIKEDEFELEIGGLVKSPVRISMRDLKDPSKFPQIEMTVTLQCSGTRRIEQIQQYPGEGDELINAPWGEGAIGTAVYKGVPLKKLLKIACGGVLPECEHLEFIGADTYFKKNHVFNYAVSVPFRKVRQHGGEEVLLAYEMNGQPLPKIHGYPLRMVVTGYIGARSCKWVYRVNALAEPSMGPVQRQEYLYFTSQVGKQNVKYSNGFSIQQMPVSSAILSPEDKQVIVHSGRITLKGWAYSGGGNWVERVEVSPDGGHVWYEVDPDNLTEKHYHAWRLWSIDLPVDAEGWLELCVRCWDSSNNTEPTFVRSAWNWGLHVTSSCHRIKIYSVNKSRPATTQRLAELKERGLDINPLTLPCEFTLEPLDEYQVAYRKRPREPRN